MGPQRGHPPPGLEAPEHHGHCRGPGQAPRFRPREAVRPAIAGSGPDPATLTSTPRRAPCWEPPDTCLPSKRSANRWTYAPTSSRAGVVLYEMATGKSPFTGDPRGVVRSLLHGVPPSPVTPNLGSREAGRDPPQGPPEGSRSPLRLGPGARRRLEAHGTEARRRAAPEKQERHDRRSPCFLSMT